jgi:hypothetical protein
VADTVGRVVVRSEGPGSTSTRVLAWVLMFACMPGPVLAAPPPRGVPSEMAPPVEDASEPPATADEPTSAVEWYARGIELAQADDYVGAAEAFLRSHELKPTPEALFNAALAYETAGRSLEAITTYRRYLAEPQADPEQQARAEASVELLLREVAVIKGLRFDTERTPVEITIAGEPHELDEFPLALTPGEIEVEVVDAQGVRGRETYALAAGEALVLDVRALWPEPEPEPEVVPEPEVEPEPARADPRVVKRAKALRISTWTGIGLTGVGLIGIGIAGGLWGDYHRREAALLCPVGEGCEMDHSADRPMWIERMNSARLASNVAIGVTAAVAVTTLAIGILAIRATRQAKRGGQVKSATHPSGRVRVSGLGFEF